MTTKRTNWQNVPGKPKTLWVSVSGLDGSGKTGLCNRLEQFFKENELRVKRSRLPHDEYLIKDLLNVSADPYTDRTIFMLDNRIFAKRFREWSESGKYDIVLTQRCFLDSFVHGAVVGYSYSWISEFNQIADLPKCHLIIHLVAEAQTAYDRIKDDPDADKFEYIEYIRKQERETRNAYKAICDKHVDLAPFHDCINIYIDTTQLSEDETFELAIKRLKEHRII